MKIACICNINHMQFTIARYLRDMGHTVSLFLLEEYDHFKPENDTIGKIDGIEIIELNWTSEYFWNVTEAEIEKTFSAYTFLIGSEWAPAFLARINRFLDIYIPIGADLIHYPFNYSTQKSWVFWKWQLKYKSLLQKHGILGCGKTFVNKNGDTNLEIAFEKMGFIQSKRYNFSLPGIYLPDLEQATYDPLFLGIKEKVETLKANGIVCIISPNRVSYTMQGVHNKGTDVLLRGLALLKKQSNREFKLFLVNYGSDVDESKQLIAKLGITDNVEWLPLMPRKLLIPLFKHFDIGFGNLKQEAYLSGISMEMSAMGLPVFQLGAEIPKKTTGVPILPYFKVTSATDIAESLESKLQHKDSIQGAENNWYKQNILEPALIALKLELTMRNKRQNSLIIKLCVLKCRNAFLIVFSPFINRIVNT